MDEEIPTGSLSGGTYFAAFAWDDLPLHSEPALVVELPLTDGILAILVLENRLVAEVGRIDGDHEELIDQWITPELVRSVSSPAVITLQWNDGKIALFRLNGRNVPRASEAAEFVLGPPDTDMASGASSSPDQRLKFDLRDRPFLTSPALKQLVQHAIRLEASLREMRSDRPEIVLDVAVLLRTLLTGKVGKDGGRLLFKCAEEIGMVPVCYTVAGLEDDAGAVPFLDETVVACNGIAIGLPNGNNKVETDLEKWLLQPALTTLHHEMPHYVLIREVADKFGAHADTDKASVLLPLMSPHDPGMNLGILLPQFRSYGMLALEVSKLVIERARSSSSH